MSVTKLEYGVMRLTAIFRELRSARTWATVRRGMFVGGLEAISEAIMNSILAEAGQLCLVLVLIQW